MRVGYEAGRFRDEDFAPLRLIERTMAFSIRYAMRLIARPTSQRSTCRMKGLLWIVCVGALFSICVALIEE